MVIEWLVEARVEFKHHIRYIHDRNRAAASRIEAEILRRVGTLKRFPFVGKLGREAGSRELVIIGTPYVVIYTVDDNVIQIIHVIHTSQQWPPEED